MREAEATVRGQLLIMTMKRRQSMFRKCSTRCMLYSLYTVLGACCTPIMPYPVYPIHGVRCTRCQLMIMTWRDIDG